MNFRKSRIMNVQKTGSPKGKLSSVDYGEIGEVFLIGLLGVILTFVTNFISGDILATALGSDGQAALIAIWTLVAKFIRNLVSDTTNKVVKK